MSLLTALLSMSSKPVAETITNNSSNQNFLLAAAALSALGAGFFLNKKGKRISKFRLKLKLAGLYLKRFFSSKKLFSRKKDQQSNIGKMLLFSLAILAGIIIALSSTGFWLIFGLVVFFAGVFMLFMYNYD